MCAFNENMTFKAITKADICHNQEIKSLFIKNVTHE